MDILLEKYEASGSHSYNELILDSTTWGENLPRSVAAVFYPVSGSCGASCQNYARDVHCRMLDFYQLTASELPLLRLTPSGLEAPFEADTVGCS